MADVRDEFLAGVLELFEARQIMKDEDRPALGTGPVEHRGGIDLEPAFLEAGHFQFVALNDALLRQPADDLRQFLETKGLHDGLPAHVGLEAEELLKGAVDQLDVAGVVEDQDSLGHAVEERLLLGGPLRGLLVMAGPDGFKDLLLAQPFLVQAGVAAAPPPMKGNGAREHYDNQHVGQHVNRDWRPGKKISNHHGQPNNMPPFVPGLTSNPAFTLQQTDSRLHAPYPDISRRCPASPG